MLNSDSIYKFFPYNPHDLDTLSNNYLWFSQFSDFNDPFEDVFLANALDSESQPYNEVEAIKLLKLFHKNQDSPEIVERKLLNLKFKNLLEDEYKHLLSTAIKAAKSSFKNLIDNYHVCCFSTDDIFNEIPALTNKLMWSHYSNGMRGYCVEFHRQELINSIIEIGGHSVGFAEMLYNNLEKPAHHTIVEQTIMSQNYGKIGFGIGDLVTIKSHEWSYEKEFRLQVDGVNTIRFDPSCIKSITVGFKMSDNKFNTLQSVLRGNIDLDCPIYRAYINPQTFNKERKKIGTTN